jgi:predicted nucleotidyltransferase
MEDKRSLEDIKYILKDIKDILKNIYTDRLVAVILYGSFAKNKATEESDIDIAVILKGEVDKMSEIGRIHDSIYSLGLERGELISVNPISEKEVKDTEWPLYYHIQREGIKV